MKRSIVPFAHRERESPEEKRSRTSKTREERLRDLENWCREKHVTLSPAVCFDSKCIAGHGMRATRDVGIGEELVRIPRSATIRHSPKLAKAFKPGIGIESQERKCYDELFSSKFYPDGSDIPKLPITNGFRSFFR